MSQTANPFADIFETFTKSMQLPQMNMPSFDMPSMDMDAVVKSGQANMEAITEAGRISVEGMQAVAQRQQEMLSEAVAELQETATDSDAMSKPLDVARERFEKSVANFRELTELASTSQTEAWKILGQRWQDSVASLQKAS